MPKTPPKRTGPSIPNRAELNDAQIRAASAKKYMPKADTKPADKPTTQAPVSEVKPKEKSKPTVGRSEKLELDRKPLPTEGAPRKNRSFAVRVLPAQLAQIKRIKAALGVEDQYLVRVLRTKTVTRLADIRDKKDWKTLADGAEARLSDARGEGALFFKAGLQLTDAETKAAQDAINDPLGMIMPHSVISAFAKAAFAIELDQLVATTVENS